MVTATKSKTFTTFSEALQCIINQYQEFLILEGDNNVNTLFRGKVNLTVPEKGQILLVWSYARKRSLRNRTHTIYLRKELINVPSDGEDTEMEVEYYYDVESVDLLGE